MKTAGSSRKDGILFLGEHYAVNLDYHKKDGTYSYALYERETAAESKAGSVPVLRGITSLFRNPSMLLSLGMTAAGTAGAVLLASGETEKNRSGKAVKTVLGAALITAEYAFTGYLFYRIYGIDGNVRRFHGAEHKAINAYQKKQSEPTVEEIVKASRISRRCGTNFVVYMMAAGMTIGLLPLGHGIFQSLLSMGCAYELFSVPDEKLPRVKSVLNALGDDFQRRITTREPHETQIMAAQEAMRILIEAEEGRLEASERELLLENGKKRGWVLPFVV